MEREIEMAENMEEEINKNRCGKKRLKRNQGATKSRNILRGTLIDKHYNESDVSKRR